jgi:hypothetical protein
MSVRAASVFAHARQHLGVVAIMLSAMSSDKEDRDPVRRPRVIKRLSVPPGRLADLKALIYELYLAAETPTLDKIAAAIIGGTVAENEASVVRVLQTVSTWTASPGRQNSPVRRADRRRRWLCGRGKRQPGRSRRDHLQVRPYLGVHGLPGHRRR